MHSQGSNRLEAGRPVGQVLGQRGSGEAGQGWRHWEPSAGMDSSLYACTRPIKKDLYVHNGVRAVTRAAVFSCMCTRSRGTTGNNIVTESRQYSLLSLRKMTRKVLALSLHKAGAARTEGKEES